MIYYFAYGSNMDQKQMKERCPRSILVGKAVLENYQLAFTIYSPERKCGCADIVKSLGDKVYGLLYKLTDNDLKNLDGYEGCPDHYRRITICVIDELREKKNVESYEVVSKAEEVIMPSADYLNLLISAAEYFEFPKVYIQYLRLSRK